MSQDVLAQEIIHSLAEAVQRGGRSLAAVPGLLRRLIDEGLWQQRNINGEAVTFNKADFRAFVETDYPVGLSTTLETLEALCGHEPKVMDFIARAKQGKPGRPIGKTNEADKRVNAQGHVIEAGDQPDIEETLRTSKGYGATTEYARNRLRESAYHIDRDTGEILGVKDERIRQLYDLTLLKKNKGGMAVNTAAIKAGLISPKVAVRLDDMCSAARTLASKLDPDQINELISELRKQRG